MVKMVNLKKSAADKRAEKEALGESGLVEPVGGEGDVSVNLEHHHLQKLGVGGGLKAGQKVELHAVGTVHHAATESGPDGDKHRATLSLHKAAIEHEADRDEERDNLRSEIAKNTDKMEKQAK